MYQVIKKFFYLFVCLLLFVLFCCCCLLLVCLFQFRLCVFCFITLHYICLFIYLLSTMSKLSKWKRNTQYLFGIYIQYNIFISSILQSKMYRNRLVLWDISINTLTWRWAHNAFICFFLRIWLVNSSWPPIAKLLGLI